MSSEKHEKIKLRRNNRVIMVVIIGENSDNIENGEK